MMRLHGRPRFHNPLGHPSGNEPSIPSRAISHHRVPSWIRLLLSIAILLGIAFRFYDLPTKIYFNDEVFTSLHSAGYTESEYATAVGDGRVHSFADVQEYQSSRSHRSIRDVIHVLVDEDPHHTPLYFALERLWTASLGDSITDRRLLAALFGVLIIPATAWLGFELFGSFLVAWLSASIVAVSPFCLLYSQQAREHTLWPLLAIISSAVLIRALRYDGPKLWVAYSVLIAAGLYSYPFFAYVVIAHATFVLGCNGLRMSRSVAAFGISTAVSVFAFAPWIVVLIMQRDVVLSETTFSAIPLPASLLLARGLFNVTTLFFDAEYRYGILVVFVVPIALLIAAAVVHVLKRCPRQPQLFLFSFVLVTALPLILEDLLFHHSRSTNTRYFMPALAGVQLIVAYYLADQLANARRLSSKLFWSAASVGLLCAAIFSCVSSLPMRAWWPNIQDADIGPIVDIIGTYPHPLVLSNSALLTLKVIDNVHHSDVSFAITGRSHALPTYDGVILFVSPDSHGLRQIANDSRYRFERLSAPLPAEDPFVKYVRAVFARARNNATKDVHDQLAHSGSSIWLLRRAH